MHPFRAVASDKGTHTAIEVARRAGRPLVVAGLVHDQEYFDNKVAPFIDDNRVKFVGLVNAEDKASLLSGAYALLHLIDFDEPFGYSVVEAMASGTPVIAYRRGSMPELISEGQTGLIVDDIDAAIQAVGCVNALDRGVVRNSVVERFSQATMATSYERLYRRILHE